MYKPYRLLFLFFLFFSVQQSGSAQCFTPIGPDLDSIMPLYQMDEAAVATDSLGNPYVLFRNDEGTSVVYFNGYVWQYLGAPHFETGVTNGLSIALSSLNEVYITYQTSTTTDCIVKKFNGSIWQNIADALVTSTLKGGYQLAADDMGNMYLSGVAYISPAYTGNVFKYNGTAWSLLGSGPFSSNISNNGVIMRVGKNNLPYVLYMDNTSAKLNVKGYDGTSWTIIGTPDFTTASLSYFTLALDTASIPYVLFQYYGSSALPRVKKLNAGAWMDVGGTGIGTEHVNDLEICFTQDNIPYTAFQNSTYNHIFLKKFNGTSWVDATTESILFPYPQFSMATNRYGLPVIVYETHYPSPAGVLTAKKLEGTHWKEYGKTGLNDYDGYAGYNTSYAVFKHNKKDHSNYLAYCESKYYGSITVLKETAGVWDTVGTAGFTPVGTLASAIQPLNFYFKMEFDTAGVPYVAFMNPPARQISVMYFNGTSWQYYGSTYIGSINSAVMDMAFDHNNRLYLAYRDNSSDKGNVVYYNGTAWTNLGSANFTPADPSGMQIVTDPWNHVFTVFQDHDHGNKMSGMFFNDTTGNWEYFATGFGNFSDAPIDLLINDLTGIMYLNFEAYTLGGMSVMEYIPGASAWFTVGDPLIDPDHWSPQAMTLDPSTGNLYAADTRSIFVHSGPAPAPWTKLANVPDTSALLYGVALNGDHTLDMLLFDRTFFDYRYYSDLPLLIGAQPLDAAFCGTGSADFAVNAFGPVTNYQWQVNSGSGFTNLTDGAVYAGSHTDSLHISGLTSAMDGNIYQCIISALCSADTTVQVELTNAMPQQVLDTAVSMCGDSIMLNAGNFGASFLWNTGDTVQIITADTSGMYTVHIANAAGCSDSDTVQVALHAFPVVTLTTAESIVCNTAGPVALTGSPAGGTYTGSGVSGSSFNPALLVPGTYFQYYHYTDVYGCSGSDTTSITSEYCTSANNLNTATAFSCFPNPAVDFVYVSSNGNVPYEITVIDFAGKIILSQSNISGNYTVDVRGFGNGVYLLKCTGATSYLQKLIVSR